MEITTASVLQSIYANSALCSLLSSTPLLHTGHSRMLEVLIGEAGARLALRLSPYLSDVDFSDSAMRLEFKPEFARLTHMAPQLRMAIVYDVVALALEAAGSPAVSRYSALTASIVDTLSSLALVTSPRIHPHPY